MSLTPQSPETKSVEVKSTQDKAIDIFDILQFDMRFNPDDGTAIYALVTWVNGYMNEGSFVEVFRDRTRLEGEDFITAITAAVNPSDSIYDNVKKALWAYMQAKGIVPAGTIS